MKVVGIFANLTLHTRDSVDLHTRQYVEALARRDVEWSFLLFGGDVPGARLNPLPGPVTLINSSKSFPVLAAKSARDALVWALTGRKIGFLRQLSDVVEARRPDLLFIDGLPLAPMVVAFKGPPAVLTCVDAMSLRQRRFVALAQGIKTRINFLIRAVACLTLERQFLSRFAIVHAVSEVDTAYLKTVSPATELRAIPVMSPVEARAPSEMKNPRVIVVWGDIAVPHVRSGIVAFLEQVPNALRDLDLRIVVVGRREPDPALQQLLQSNPSIDYRQWVEDLNKELADAAAVVLPDESGTGIKNRTLHAMALGAVVIGTPAALEGVAVQSGKNAFLCSTPAQFAQAIRQVLSDTDTARAVACAASGLIAERYSEQVVGGQWKALLEDAVKPGQAR